MSNNKKLVKKLINEGYLKSPHIIEAFLAVDRADFVPKEFHSEAYGDYPLSIGYGQTISQPATVAFMLELLEPQTRDSVLEIGAGSCWQTAMLAKIAEPGGKVFAIERISELLEIGKVNISKYQFKNIRFFCQDGTKGLKEYSPYDKIIAAAAGSEIPSAWMEQLKIGGRIVMPIANSIWLYIKKTETEFEKHEYPGFVFVPLVKE